MREQQVKHQIDKLVAVAKGQHSADEYTYGVRDGCQWLLDWLIQQGVVKR